MNKKQLLLLLLVILSASAQQQDNNKNVKKFSGDEADSFVLSLNNNLNDDLEAVRRLAREHNFELKKQIGDNNVFILKSLHEHVIKRRNLDDNNSTHSSSSSSKILSESIINDINRLKRNPLVQNMHREKVIIRTKRDFIKMDHTMRSPPLTIQERMRARWMDRRHKMLKNNKYRASNLFTQQQQNPFATQSQRTWPGQDPQWKDMWYLNRNLDNPSLPDMNVISAWQQGYTGRGVSVTFLDDGLEWNHPDILQNYNAKASYDMNEHDDDPMPRYDPTNENKHGTRCGGQVSAVANNSICSVGIAYNSGIGGIKMLDGDVTDSIEAASLSHNMHDIDVYSASWGPDDNGEVVDGPGPLTRQAFINGATRGRNGRGSIYVWASGNGGRYNDSCSCDGYANSIYTLSISSTSELGERPWYLEECASTLATTYSSGDQRKGEREIFTTDIRHKCTGKHTGTSAAAPMAAGIIALSLEANPKLTWRDIMYLTVLTSRPKAIKSNKWVANKRGFLVSTSYGFGLMDAGKMVSMAKTWQNVPQMVSCSVVNSKFNIETVSRTHSVVATLNTDACQNTINEVNFIEQVEIIVSIAAKDRGKLEIFLTSPMGTRTNILPARQKDTSSAGFKRWAFMSVLLWGEFPRGQWRVEVSSNDDSEIVLSEYSLVIHGTKTKPVDYESLMSTTAIDVSLIKMYEQRILNEQYYLYNSSPSSSSSSSSTLSLSFLLFINFFIFKFIFY